MLDRLFLSNLSATGKAAYFIGQVLAIIAVAVLVFGVWGMDFRDGQMPLLIGALVTIVAWGPICMAIWPKEASVDEAAAEEFDDLNDL
jgi:hypothetical protein